MESYNGTLATTQLILSKLGARPVEQALIDKQKIDEINQKDRKFEDSSRKVTWFATQKTKVDVQVKDVQKSLDYVRMLKKMKEATKTETDTWLPLTFSNHVRMEGSFNTADEEVIVSLGAEVYLPMNYDDAEEFFVEQLKKADMQLKQIDEDLKYHTKVVSDFSDEALRLRYGIKN